jgi:eukaryotic-like serine/threonine-protein kinase
VDRTVADPMIGRVLDGRYLVGPRVARGGMATVYEATDLRLDRLCALKVMHAGLGDDGDFAGRFVREARAAARLSHPHVVGVFDQGDDDGTLFLAMEYVPGGTLRDLIRTQAPMAPAQALALLDPLLSALAAAHKAGLIHRDVKPENVLLSEDGRVKVADFGLARAVTAHTQHTTAGVLIGTVSYLSPELLVDGRADARSDVYAAGVVLYEMLTGRKPHEGDSAIQVAYKHVHEDVPAPSRLVPGLPAYVDALVARATARNPDLRPADARVLLHQVRRVRAALDHGVVDDPELTCDLAPTVPVQRLGGVPDIDYVRDEPAEIPTVLSPEQAVRTATPTTSSEDTTAFGSLPRSRPAPAGGRTRGPEEPRRSPSRRRGPVLLSVVLLLAVAAAVGGWWFGAGRFTTTPGVVNLSARAAGAKVAAAGLTFRVAGRAYSETVPVGAVVRTRPAGGHNVPRHGTVSAVVSRGPERHPVPSLATMPLASARTALTGSHLTVGEASYAWSDKVAKGVVLRSDPRPGTVLRRGAAVDLVVSKGPAPVRVPHLTGKDADAGTSTLRRLGLKVASTERNSRTVAKGDVISQAPASGRLLRGDTVRLVVSKGPVLVEVPEVRRMSAEHATSALEKAGFRVSTDHVQYYLGLGIVVQETPGAGDLAPQGSTITISVI